MNMDSMPVLLYFVDDEHDHGGGFLLGTCLKEEKELDIKNVLKQSFHSYVANFTAVSSNRFIYRCQCGCRTGCAKNI
jgi:hypothetical protein